MSDFISFLSEIVFIGFVAHGIIHENYLEAIFWLLVFMRWEKKP